METDKKRETSEKERKLMKSEVKQLLAGARDYLLNMELPPSEITTVRPAPCDGKPQLNEDEVTEVDKPKDIPVSTKTGVSGR
jgi:hypothetical protein